MKIRLKFTKLGLMKYIGHLDLMRTFQKIFRQANIPIAYSEGFNPHQIFSIAAPLSVGITSESEYLDLKLVHNMNLSLMIEQINACCPNGLKIEEAIELDEKEPAAMACVSAAEYQIIQKKYLVTSERVSKFISQAQIMVQKKTKKGRLNDVDIKPGILNFIVEDEIIQITLATGSVFNIKPDTVLNAYCSFFQEEFLFFDYQIHRKSLYRGKENLFPLSIPVL